MDGVDLRAADLCGAKLDGTVLNNAKLSGADLRSSKLFGAKLKDADLFDAKLNATEIIAADLSGADLRHARLDGTRLLDVDLSHSNMMHASLAGASLRGVDLKDSDLRRVDVAWAVWQPHNAPDPGKLGGILGLQSLRSDPSKPDLTGMELLKIALREGRHVDGERAVTRAIEGERTRLMFGRFLRDPLENSYEGVAATVRHLVWGLTTDYGFRPLMAVAAWLLVWAVFVPVYFVHLWSRDRILNQRMQIVRRRRSGSLISDRDGRSWAVASEDAIEPIVPADVLAALRIAGNFSMTSALRVGVGPVNLGEWVTRLSRDETETTAVGTMRVVAGLQSLLATGVAAIWAISAFGRPFE